MPDIDITMWQTRIGRAEDLQAKKKNERIETIKLLKGEFFGEPFRKGGETSELNFVYEYEKIKVGSTYSRDPFIFARATNSQFADFAFTMQTVLNYYWSPQGLKMKQKVKKAIKDGILIPPGWIGIGFTGQLQKMRRQENLLEETRSRNQKTEGQLGILDETIKRADVFAKHVSSWNMIWPDGYHDIRKAPYLIEIQELPLIDIVNNPILKDSKFDIPGTLSLGGKIKRVKPHTMSANIPIARDTSSQDLEIPTVKLYHIWDKRSNRRFTLAENFHTDTLFDRDWNYLIEGFPYYDLIFNEVPQTDQEANSYPMSDITPMLPQLRDLSIINSAILRHGKRAGSVILGRKGTMKDEEIANIQNAGDIDLILLESLGEEVLRHWTTPSLPKDWYSIRSLIIEDLMRISGFQQLLAQAKGIETATESENLRAGQLIRQSESRDIVEDFTVDIARGLAGLIWQFIPRERISQIIGEQANEKMWPMLPDDPEEARKIIQDEIQIRIDAGSSSPPKDEAVERKQLTDLAFGIQGAFPGRLKADKFVVNLLKRYPHMKDADDMVFTNDEQEIAVAQEENKLLLQGIRQLVSPNENHMLHLQVHGQAGQVPGAQLTKEFDDHVLDHAKLMEQNQPKVSPQQGDTKISPLTTQPELRRGGVPEKVDLTGAASAQRGVGGNVGI